MKPSIVENWKYIYIYFQIDYYESRKSIFYEIKQRRVGKDNIGLPRKVYRCFGWLEERYFSLKKKSIWAKVKLTTDIQVTRNVNIKLSERLVTREKRCYANVQYSMRECPELSGIPASISDNSLESNVLEILEEEIDVPIYSSFVEDCHCLPFKGSPKKFLKSNLSKRHLKFVGIEIRNLLIRWNYLGKNKFN